MIEPYVTPMTSTKVDSHFSHNWATRYEWAFKEIMTINAGIKIHCGAIISFLYTSGHPRGRIYKHTFLVNP